MEPEIVFKMHWRHEIYTEICTDTEIHMYLMEDFILYLVTISFAY